MGHLLLICLFGDAGRGLSDLLELTESRRYGDRVIWVSRGSPATLSPVLARLLEDRRIASAALVPMDLPDDRLWVACEWHGAFVVTRALLTLLGDHVHEWVEAAGGKDREFAILLPVHAEERSDMPAEAATAEVETPAEYRAALAADTPVVVHARLAAVMEDLPRWFGELADPTVGGCYALLALSGAGSDSTAVTLRSPAALGLRRTVGANSLTAHTQAGRIRARGHGFEHASDLRLPPDDAERVQRELRGHAASYAVMLELEAVVDPVVEIAEGIVFEQTSVNGVQTLAAAVSRRVTVNPGALVPLALPAWCLNDALASPSGQPVRGTPFMLARTPGSQREIWADRDRIHDRRGR